MKRLTSLIGVSVVGLVVLVAAGPPLMRLLHVAVLLVAVVGAVLVAVRVVWYFTSRY